VYLLPSLFTMGNLFCGYACIVHAMRGDYETAAPFIGFAVVLDILDGRIARMTGSTSAFGVAPAVLAFSWGLTTFGRLGWAAGFVYVAAAAIRLARFNIQGMSATDKRYFAGLPSPAAASVPASTVFAYPYGLTGWYATLALPVVLVPAFLMVSTIRYVSFKTNELKKPRSYRRLILVALAIVAIATHPQATLVAMAYTYLVSPLGALIASRLRRRRAQAPGALAPPASSPAPPPPDATPNPAPRADAYRDL
jgi:CDP-diacylglycerol--serine O-phosphatidyltransferase